MKRSKLRKAPRVKDVYSEYAEEYPFYVPMNKGNLSISRVTSMGVEDFIFFGKGIRVRSLGDVAKIRKYDSGY